MVEVVLMVCGTAGLPDASHFIGHLKITCLGH